MNCPGRGLNNPAKSGDSETTTQSGAESSALDPAAIQKLAALDAAQLQKLLDAIG